MDVWKAAFGGIFSSKKMQKIEVPVERLRERESYLCCGTAGAATSGGTFEEANRTFDITVLLNLKNAYCLQNIFVHEVVFLQSQIVFNITTIWK